MQLFQKTHFDFMRMRYRAYAVSIILLGAGVVSLIQKGGPKLGIDFTGGNLVQLAFKQDVPMKDLRDTLQSAGHTTLELQAITGRSAYIIRVPKGTKEVHELSMDFQRLIQEKFPGTEPIEERAEFVGPAVGRALSDQALSSILWAGLLIILYVAFRFRSGVWGICSVVALLHDVITVIGLLSILNKEITITVVAALLTLAGYSMNDTIVVYDRMRENLRLSKKESFYELVNRSINETLSRTVVTSVSVILTLLVLFFFGGEVIHDFALVILVGIVIGTYSSIFVAAPIIYEWQGRRSRGKN